MTEKNTVYLIRCQQSGLHKIGITGKWGQRSRQLRVGSKTSVVRVVRVNDGPALEKRLHKRYDAVRVPQTEYFQLSDAQLQDVLQVLEKASADCSKAATVEQGSLTRPRFDARQRTDEERVAYLMKQKAEFDQADQARRERAQQRPGPPTPAQLQASGPATAPLTNEQATVDQVRRIRAQQQAEQTEAYWAQEARNRQIRADQAAARQQEKAGAAVLPFWIVAFMCLMCVVPGSLKPTHKSWQQISAGDQLAIVAASGFASAAMSAPLALVLAALFTASEGKSKP